MRCAGASKLLAVSALISLAVAGGPRPTAAQEVTFFQIGTGSTAGTYFPVGALIASAISSPPGSRPCDLGGSCGVPGLIAVATATQGSVANVEAVAAGVLASGLAQADIVNWAFHGDGLYAEKGPVPDIRVIANLYPESVHLVVRKAANIKTIADLRGRRVSLDTQGSGTRVNAKLILSAFQVKEDQIEALATAPDHSIELLLDDAIDAFFLVAGYPVTAVSELASSRRINLLEIKGEPVKRLLAQHSFFATDTIPADAYSGIDETETLSVGAQWIVDVATDENLVYEITKALWHPNNRGILDSGHAKARLIRPKTALIGVSTPLHPGAARYYREVGLLE